VTTISPIPSAGSARSRSSRIRLRTAVLITPVVTVGSTVRLTEESSDSIPAQTANLSLRGIGLVHLDPFRHRFAAITFDLPGADRVSILAEWQWTLDGADGLHHSGARFLAVIEAFEPTGAAHGLMIEDR